MLSLNFLPFGNHLDIRLRAHYGTQAATLTISIITLECVFAFSINTTLGTNHNAHLTGNTVLLEEFGFFLNSPGTGLIIS
jgi:hypothetical protein